mmetsp:Transcript_7632/g.7008  ORF Transcript_7632/g.7008 Transcript_7632/m.7008 type:complete len:161 (+) Transcript_7632:1058-1540(+)
MGKSVTFNQQVRVREYDNSAKEQVIRNIRTYPSRAKEEIPQYLTPSPLKESQNVYEEKNPYTRSPVRALNYTDSESHFPNSYEKQNGSPLKIKQRENQAPQMSGEFNQVEKGEIAKIFKDIIFLERELETIRIELSLKPDFNVPDAFAMLDLHKRGTITP